MKRQIFQSRGENCWRRGTILLHLFKKTIPPPLRRRRFRRAGQLATLLYYYIFSRTRFPPSLKKTISTSWVSWPTPTNTTSTCCYCWKSTFSFCLINLTDEPWSPMSKLQRPFLSFLITVGGKGLRFDGSPDALGLFVPLSCGNHCSRLRGIYYTI